MFQLEILPAEYGDCILITYGRAEKPSQVLIDAGTEPTWASALQPRLAEVRELELLVLTHVDADHIGGAIPFLHQDRQVEVRDVWFNGWKHLPSSGLLSALQGEIFSTLIRHRSLRWNAVAPFEGGAVAITENKLPVAELEGGLRLTLLSPTLKGLSRLARKWKTEVTRHKLTPGAHGQYRQFLARHPTLSTHVPDLAESEYRGDSSVPNGSSIAFLAELEDGSEPRAVLFAADAHASVLSRSIKLLLAQRQQTRLRLDACKVSHHGSRGNTNNGLLGLLDCPRYLISCNGDRYNLPDNETIGRIVQHGGSEPQLLFNYHCDRTEVWASLEKKYGFSAVYGDGGYLKLDLGKTA